MVLFQMGLIVIAVAGLSLLISGFLKKKQLFVLFGGMAFLAPVFWLLGWNLLLPMAPPIALAASLPVKNKDSSLS